MRTAEQERATTQVPSSGQTGTGAWSWILQRVSGALLLFFVLAHFWVLHYAFVGEQITFSRVLARVQTPFFVFLDSGLLAVVLYHALNGVFEVVADFGLTLGAQRVLAVVLWIIGIATLIVGVNALLPLMGSKPFMTLGA